MKKILLFVIAFTILVSCDRDPDLPRPIPTNEPTLVLGQWSLVRVTMVNPPPYYRNSLGLTPSPGIYEGNQSDYFTFKTNGFLVVKANGNTDSTKYDYQNEKLTIEGDVFKNLILLANTTKSLSFECRDTSSNGGTYYHKIELVR